MKYTIDTNLYINAVRDPAPETALSEFLEQFGPLTYLHAVVIQELRAGARTSAQANALKHGILGRFERVGRCSSTSVAAFKERGWIFVDLWRTNGVPFSQRSRSLVNDIRIAASCRESGVTLITADGDYDLITPHLKGFRYITP